MVPVIHTRLCSGVPNHESCHVTEPQPPSAPCPFPEQDPATATCCPTLVNPLARCFSTPVLTPTTPVSASIAASLEDEAALHRSGQEHRNRIIKQKCQLPLHAMQQAAGRKDIDQMP